MSAWEMVIGLEVHAQVLSQAKLFSPAPTAFGAEPNCQVNIIDAAFPGVLPTINEGCVSQGIRAAIALKARLHHRSVFERKHYFYPDLPLGYQISQYQHPLATQGFLLIDLPDGNTKSVGITRLHLEMDSGKSLHDQHPEHSYIDLNRSGVGLLEIVSEPELHSPEEATAYMHKLRLLLRYIGVCDGNMEEGSLRCDANISLRRSGGQLGTRCEIKNLNSIRFLQQALRYEAQRQQAILEQPSGQITQETLLWDQNLHQTRPMRSKESAHDYRYFPDPDLLPLEVSADWIEQLAAELPELPDDKRHRWLNYYGLPAAQVTILTAEPEVAEAFEHMIGRLERDNPQHERHQIALQLGHFITGDWFGALHKYRLTWSGASPLTHDQLVELVQMRLTNQIAKRQLKELLEAMLSTGQDAATIIKVNGWQQLNDHDTLTTAVEQVFVQYPDQVEQYRAGKDKLFGFLVGQVMKLTKGQAEPGLVNQLLRERLSK